MQIVGIALVRNEDSFVEQAIRNVADFCDRVYVVDHMSKDGTWEIVEGLDRELDHLQAVRSRHSRVSHEVLEQYAGTETWVLGVDGDELYDPAGLAGFREQLVGGAHSNVFRLRSTVLNAVELDPARHLASGYLSPPSRAITKLFNFAAIDSWTGCPERLHHGVISFRPGMDVQSEEHLGEQLSWEESPFRCLHVCFLRRSSRDSLASEGSDPRPNLEEHRLYRRSPLGRLARRTRGQPSADRSSWKQDKYRRGELTTKNVASFFPSRS
jgi:glycosyltransferase involved in cell wall biosynthesis